MTEITSVTVLFGTHSGAVQEILSLKFGTCKNTHGATKHARTCMAKLSIITTTQLLEKQWTKETKIGVDIIIITR